MADEMKPLSSLFQDRLFRIPDYQRGYAWQTSQLVDFWDDLINLQDGRYHYTGLLSLKTLKRNEIQSWGNDLWVVERGYKPCHIIDGQQRLTTFVILLNELISFVRNLKENRNKSDNDITLGFHRLSEIVSKYIYQRRPPQNMITTYLFGYDTDDPSDRYLRYRVFEESFSGEITETYYTKNLRDAKNFFKENVKALYEVEGIDGIEQIYQKLTQRLMFNIHEINDDYDVFVAFETMNNRGKPLTNLELLKNRLIYLSTIYSDDVLDEQDKNALRVRIRETWKEIYKQLGRNSSRPLLDDEFLRAHWIIYFTYTRHRGDDYIKYLLNKFSANNVFEKKTVIEKQEQESLLENPIDYDEDEVLEVESDDEMDELSNEQISVTLEPSEIRDYIDSLKDIAKFWYESFFPNESSSRNDDEKLWLDRLNRIGIGYFRPLVTVALCKCDNAIERINLFKAIERFIFIAFRIGMSRSNNKSSVFNPAARDVYRGVKTVVEVTSELEEASNSSIQFALNAFENDLEKKFKTGKKEGYYAWKSLKYFMYEYEYSLKEKTNIKRISWELFAKSDKDKVSIEHILPQTPTKWYWRNQFRQFISNKDEMARLTGSLGNLLPLSQSINSSLQNDCFEEKKNPSREGRRGYVTGSNSEIEVSRKSDWDAIAINERSKQLIDFLNTRWNIQMTEDQKESLLFDDFIFDGREVPPPIPTVDDEEEHPDNNEAMQKKEYWEYALPRIKEALGGEGCPYDNRDPVESGNIDGHFGISTLHPYCNLRTKGEIFCSAGIYIDAGTKEKTKAIFDLLYSHRNEIEFNTSMKPNWDRKNDSRAASVSFKLNGVDWRKKANWEEICSFHSKMLKELCDYFYRPYEDKIRLICSCKN